MTYIDLLSVSSWLKEYYPHYDKNELTVLLDDVLKWLQNELPEDSSTLTYLKNIYTSQSEAVQNIWSELQLFLGSYYKN